MAAKGVFPCESVALQVLNIFRIGYNWLELILDWKPFVLDDWFWLAFLILREVFVNNLK